jgi:hypothetical protein
MRETEDSKGCREAEANPDTGPANYAVAEESK